MQPADQLLTNQNCMLSHTNGPPLQLPLQLSKLKAEELQVALVVSLQLIHDEGSW